MNNKDPQCEILKVFLLLRFSMKQFYVTAFKLLNSSKLISRKIEKIMIFSHCYGKSKFLFSDEFQDDGLCNFESTNIIRIMHVLRSQCGNIITILTLRFYISGQ